jgi:hypothetical protein
VKQLHEKVAPYEAMRNNLGEYMGDIHSKGGDPIQYTRHLLEIDRRIRNAPDPQSKLGVLLTMADAYNIPLRQVIQGATGVEVPTPQQPQVPPQILQELQEMRQWRQSMVSTTAEQEVAHFSDGKEFFGDVRERMASMMESGAAANLDQAYEMACWATPEVREVLLQRERSGVGRQQLNERQQRAAGASLPAGGAISVPASEDDADDVGSILRAEFTRQATGRV